MTSVWIGMGEAAKRLNMTPDGAKKRLRRLQKHHEINFMRKFGGRWEVNGEILKQLMSCPDDFVDQQLDNVRAEIATVNQRITAVRDVGKKFRKKTEKRLDLHENQLRALMKLSEAANDVVKSFKPGV